MQSFGRLKQLSCEFTNYTGKYLAIQNN